MSMTHSKSDLVRTVAARKGLPQTVVAGILDDLLDTILNAARAGETVSLRGFGRFRMKSRAARTGRNPQTGAPVAIPASERLGFTAAKPAS